MKNYMLSVFMLIAFFSVAQNSEDIRRDYVGKFSVQEIVNTNDQYNNAVAISKTNLRYPEKLYVKTIQTKQFKNGLLTLDSKENFNNTLYSGSIVGKFDRVSINVLYSMEFNSYVIIKSYYVGDKVGTNCDLLFSAYGDLLRIEKSIYSKEIATRFIYHLN
jgi:thioredoxin-related protein